MHKTFQEALAHLCHRLPVVSLTCQDEHRQACMQASKLAWRENLAAMSILPHPCSGMQPIVRLPCASPMQQDTLLSHANGCLFRRLAPLCQHPQNAF